jgi:hypothetical protein
MKRVISLEFIRHRLRNGKKHHFIASSFSGYPSDHTLDTTFDESVLLTEGIKVIIAVDQLYSLSQGYAFIT